MMHGVVPEKVLASIVGLDLWSVSRIFTYKACARTQTHKECTPATISHRHESVGCDEAEDESRDLRCVSHESNLT